MFTIYAFKHFVVGPLIVFPPNNSNYTCINYIGYAWSSLDGGCNQSQLTIKLMKRSKTLIFFFFETQSNEKTEK